MLQIYAAQLWRMRADATASGPTGRHRCFPKINFIYLINTGWRMLPAAGAVAFDQVQ
jgi:hypothetical protein